MSFETAIKKTIEYLKKYDYYPNKEELIFRLISPKIYSKKTIDNYLLGINYQKNTKTNLEILKRKIYLAKNFVKNIEKNKNILLIGITGSVAAGNPNINDDIDLLIITKKNKLWITRLQIKWRLTINGISHRRYGDKEKADQFCFNLWLDERELTLPKEKQNLKNGMDLILMKPILNREETYQKFLEANRWVKKYVATGYAQLIKRFKKLKVQSETNYQILELIPQLINYLLFKSQFWFMKSKIKHEIVDLKRAFFHPNG